VRLVSRHSTQPRTWVRTRSRNLIYALHHQARPPLGPAEKAVEPDRERGCRSRTRRRRRRRTRRAPQERGGLAWASGLSATLCGGLASLPGREPKRPVICILSRLYRQPLVSPSPAFSFCFVCPACVGCANAKLVVSRGIRYERGQAHPKLTSSSKGKLTAALGMGPLHPQRRTNGGPMADPRPWRCAERRR
jgi:hypothetical protein